MARPEEKLRCTKEPYIEDVGTQQIKSIRFSMFSGNEIQKSAEVQVYESGIYGKDSKPMKNGLIDTRMSCGRVLLAEKDRREFLQKMRNPKADAVQKSAIMRKMRDKCKLSCCPCEYINGVVKKGQSGLIILHDCTKTVDGGAEELRSALSHKKEKVSVSAIYMLDPVTVLSLFKRMLDEDCELLNLGDRPEKLIVTELAVPPVPIRPSVVVDGTKSNEDSITVLLKSIVLTNAILKEKLDVHGLEHNTLVCWQQLQLKVVEYINSDAPSLVGSQHRGLVQRLKGKTGRFRGNLSGKRTEYTGRTVISPDPNLKITEVAIPVLMARVLTYPERVSYYNIEKLRQCIRDGPNKHPGANFIIQPDGAKLHLKYCDRRIAAWDLKYGCIVERHLEDGDIVLFNRQPSLHRMSIMSHRAKIMPWRTLRFNESVCNPYNADFDGDEMNLHVPQTEEARTEALVLMGVQNNLCTAKNGEILVASTQDFLTSSFLVTRKDTFYDRSSFSLLCSYLGDAMENIDLPTPALIKPIELWTGKQLFSVLVRPNACTKVFLNFTVKEKIYTTSETMCPNDGFVYFRNSDLISGQVGKATLGSGNKDGMFSVLVRDYNSHAAASCMNRLAKFSARFIGNHGFSIGVDDVQPGEHLNQQKKKKIDEGYRECHELISSYSKGELTLQPGCNAAQTLELEITGVLNQIRATAGNVCMDTLHWRNSPLIMSQCGSKGSPINISQMVACVGQQSVGGRRAPNGFIDRALPHFPINSKTPAAKGFVANSFYTGLTATEFFFHTMGGREGLVDTAATCPQSRQDTLSPAEILEILNDKLSEHDMLSEGGCSEKFKQLLTNFLEERVKFLKNTRRVLHLDQERVGKKSSSVDECIAANISGISEKQLQVFLDTCLSRYRSKKIEAGASIGAIGAQSIGEPGTQMTLKTFHFAGVASMNVTLGVPRIKEIINATKKISTPIITTELLSGHDVLSARIVKSSIEKAVLGEVATAMKIVLDAELGRAYLVVELDMRRIKALHMGISYVSLRESILKHPKTKLKDEHVSVSVNGEKVELKIYPVETDKRKLRYELHKLKSMLPQVIVKGIPTVERAVINKIGEKYNLLVEGTNLLAVMGTPGIDDMKTKSNHIIEVHQTLGIEAARRSIIDEIQYTMKSHGMNIDLRHMMLLADLMTYRGEILGITRYGIAKMKASVLMLASFEKTSEHLFNASYSGRVDQIEGVSECIIMGLPMKLGTGILKIRQRVQHLPEFKYQPEPILSQCSAGVLSKAGGVLSEAGSIDSWRLGAWDNRSMAMEGKLTL